MQLLKTALPCLVTVLEGINEMRFATMDDMFRAARYPLKVWDKAAAGIEDLEQDRSQGLADSRGESLRAPAEGAQGGAHRERTAMHRRILPRRC